MGESDDSTYVAPALPPFDMPAGTDGASVANAVQAYMSQPGLAAIGSLSLACAELRDAAMNGRVLPVREVMDELGAHVRNALWYADLRLEQWFDAPHQLHAAERVQAALLRDMADAAAAAIKSLAQEALVERARHAPLPASPTESQVGVKRQRDEDPFDPVKSKAARLAALIAGARAGVVASQAVVEATRSAASSWRYARA